MLRLAEGLVTVTAQQRALLHDLVVLARALHEASAWMDRLASEEEGEEGALALPAQAPLRAQLGAQATHLELAAESVAQVSGLWATVAGAMRVDAALAGVGQEKLGGVEIRLRETAGALRCVFGACSFVCLSESVADLSINTTIITEPPSATRCCSPRTRPSPSRPRPRRSGPRSSWACVGR